MSYIGTIKSYNPQKGWGFIECGETHQIYGKDMFVLKTSLPGGSVDVGDVVSFSVAQGAQGVEATGVSFAKPSSPYGLRPRGGGPYGSISAARRGPPQSAAPSSSYAGGDSIGVVKSYNTEKGWGFITSPEIQRRFGKDIFFMKTSFNGSIIQAGHEVAFTVTQGRKGAEAVDIYPVSPGFGGGFALGSPRRGVPSDGHYALWGQAVSAAAASPTSISSPLTTSSNTTFVGSVKSFNEEKGWGHIACDAASAAYGKDVFLMRSALEGAMVFPGSLLTFKVSMSAKGPQAQDVVVLPPGSIGVNGEEGEVFSGTVKSFNESKGWGFVTSDQVQQIFGKDIFLHKQELNGAVPTTGSPVSFSVDVGRTGQLEARGVSLGVGGGGGKGGFALARWQPSTWKVGSPY